MLVVADSSPLIVLVNIGQVNVLPQLFGEVAIPPQVADELGLPKRPAAVRELISSSPPWLQIRPPTSIEPISHLHDGETAAISLARQLNADLLLIDEVAGRKAARDRNISITGTIGVLELAASRGMLHLADAFERVKRTDFWISHKLLDERLRVFLGGANP